MPRCLPFMSYDNAALVSAAAPRRRHHGEMEPWHALAAQPPR